MYVDMGRTPQDRRTPLNVYLNTTLVYICYVCISFAILLALILLIFNVVTMWKPYV